MGEADIGEVGGGWVLDGEKLICTPSESILGLGGLFLNLGRWYSLRRWGCLMLTRRLVSVWTSQDQDWEMKVLD